jgi:hypothetical protein
MLDIGRRAATGALDRVETGVERIFPDGPTVEAAGSAGPGVVDLQKARLASADSAPATSFGTGAGMPDKPAGGPETLAYDPFALIEQLGYREKPTTLTYATLQAMVWKVPMINAIIQTRVNQMASFCRSQTRRDQETGFIVRMRDLRDKPSPADRKRAREIEQLLLTTGVTDDVRSRSSFEQIIRKMTRDSLTYDQVNLEVVPDAKGRPACWYVADPVTIRLADSSRITEDDSLTRPHTVQIYDNVVINEYTRKEMVFGVRNPRSDIRNHGYGTSELEMLITTVTQLLWGLQYNANFFSQGSVAKGLLNMKGAIPEKQLRAFRRQWYQMISGVENAFRTPIVNAEDIQWVPMQESNRDMEFSAWIDFLIKVACSIYMIDPVEVNFNYGSGGGKQMFEGAHKTKIVESKARGLLPMLRFFEDIFNQHIIWQIDPNFALEFTGLDPMTPKEMQDLKTQRVRTYQMVDELRAEEDLPPLPHNMGEVVLDPNWMMMRRDQILQEQAEEAARQLEEELKEQERQGKVVAGVSPQPPTEIPERGALPPPTAPKKPAGPPNGKGKVQTKQALQPSTKKPSANESVAELMSETAKSMSEAEKEAKRVLLDVII